MKSDNPFFIFTVDGADKAIRDTVFIYLDCGGADQFAKKLKEFGYPKNNIKEAVSIANTALDIDGDNWRLAHNRDSKMRLAIRILLLFSDRKEAMSVIRRSCSSEYEFRQAMSDADEELKNNGDKWRNSQEEFLRGPHKPIRWGMILLIVGLAIVLSICRAISISGT